MISKNDIEIIFAYLFGDEQIKKKNRKLFIDICMDYDPELLFHYVDKMHLSALVYIELDNCSVINSFSKSYLKPTVTFQKLHYIIHKNILSDLSVKFQERNISPIILKGPSYWDWLYSPSWIRRTRDLDLLIYSIEQLKSFITVIEDDGFHSNQKNDDEIIYDDNRYELFSYLKIINKELSKEELNDLNWLLERGLRISSIAKVSNSNADFYIEVEPHKSLFLKSHGELLCLNDNDFISWETNSSYRTMKISSLLPYISTKFFHDCNFGHHQCFKLIKDFILILNYANEETIQTSILKSEEWNCAHYYAEMFRLVHKWLPKIELTGLDLKSKLKYDEIISSIQNSEIIK